MICEGLTARLHLVDAAQSSLRSLGACLARCDLEVEELVSAPFAAGLATLVEDEKQLGVAVVDMGGGTTSLAVFHEGHLVHTAQLPVGGWNVTNDLARGLSTPIAHAERLKTLHGGAFASPEDEKEWLPVPMVGEEEDHIARIPRAMVINIIRPRLEETFELLRDRLEGAGIGDAAGRRVVLTGGASQLVGVRELAARILDRQVRLGRPHPVRGLPETASGPAFAGPVGLLAWCAGEGRPLLDIQPGLDRPRGVFRRLVEWLRDRA
jgi:cell division protein FtsA